MAEDRLHDLLGGVPGTGAAPGGDTPAPVPAVVDPGLCEFQEVKTILDTVLLSIESLRKGYNALSETLYGVGDAEAQLLDHADGAKSGLSQAVTKLKATEAALDVELGTFELSGLQAPTSHKMRRRGWLANNVRLAAYVGRLMEVQERGMAQRSESARRQHRIAAPDATDEEIEAAIAAGRAAFAQALASPSDARDRAGAEGEVECKRSLLVVLLTPSVGCRALCWLSIYGRRAQPVHAGAARRVPARA
jgi:hypothetical protein